jgi:plasmid stabilization system protein ParE
MAYTPRISERAYEDINAITGYIQADSPRNATRWRSQVFAKIAALGFSPRSYSMAPEAYYAPSEIRQALFGRYRILFEILDDEQCVHVLTVRHSARQLLDPDELSDIR